MAEINQSADASGSVAKINFISSALIFYPVLIKYVQ